MNIKTQLYKPIQYTHSATYLLTRNAADEHIVYCFVINIVRKVHESYRTTMLTDEITGKGKRVNSANERHKNSNL